MSPGRRLSFLLVVLLLAGLPPVVLRALCVGKTCGSSSSVSARVPFCPLPDAIKTLVAAGYRSGRSPDVLGVTVSTTLASRDGVAWPTTTPLPDTRVPIALFGAGIAPRVPLPEGTGLDQIAPTLADALHFRRDHPEVRAGTAVPGVASGAAPRLVVEIVWKGVGTADLKAAPGEWPYLRRLTSGAADATLDGTTGSVPMEPAATLTTIGTGGLPSQHGITGPIVRNDSGDIVPAWGPGAPASIISTLPDDLDFKLGEAPRIGLVAPDATDRGLIGGNWYVPHDRDDVVIGRGDPMTAVRRLLASGYGADGVPDLLGVVLGGSIPSMDRITREVVAAAEALHVPAAFVVTATGTLAPATAMDAASVVAGVDAAVPSGRAVVAGAVAGGVFLDQDVLAQSGLSSNAAVDAMLKLRSPGGDERLFTDAFPGFAVSFARYC